ncbi:Int [Pseudomonas putida BIRD-1]|nr:Int [Pseudomonas putida BIRD-1]
MRIIKTLSDCSNRSEWIADQMGYTLTAMIFKHYAKWISEDGPDAVGLLNQALRLT